MSNVSTHLPTAAAVLRLTPRRSAALICAAALTTIGGGGAALASSPPGGSVPSGSIPADTGSTDTAAAEPVAFAVNLTPTSIDGLPADLAAGLVDVTVTDETEGAGAEVNFSRVDAGTDPATFAADLVKFIAGKPLPDYFLDTAGVIGHGMTVLEEGEYIVWIDLANNLDRDSTADDIVTAALTVGPGNDDAVIPPTDGAIRAGDYLFDVDVSAGGSTVTFTNSSDNQFHHVILVDFGSNDPAVVEAISRSCWPARAMRRHPRESIRARSTSTSPKPACSGRGAAARSTSTFEAGHTYARVVLRLRPRGRPAARHPAPHVRRVPGQLISPASSEARPEPNGASAAHGAPVPSPRDMYRFLVTPKWIGFHLLVIVLIVAMINLGFWQLRRLDQKRERADTIAARIDLAPGAARLARAGDVDRRRPAPVDAEWRSIDADGHYLPDDQFYVINRSQDGLAGDMTVTPLQLDDGRILLVERGFVPAGSEAQAAPPPDGEVHVVGRLRRSQRHAPGQLTNAPTGVLTDVQQFDIPRLAEQMPGPVVPMYIEMTSSTPVEAGPYPTPVDPPERDLGPHLSYAIQWFIFSVCVAVGWVLAVRRSLATRRRDLGRVVQG